MTGPSSQRLKDKVILVTGATTGIGAAIAQRFEAEGAQVAIHGEPGTHGLPKTLYADLTDPEAPAKLMAETIERFGRIDGLVNNAAITSHGTLETTDAAHFDFVISLNLRAPLLLIREALPHFRNQGGGSVLNIGSVNSYSGAHNLLAYSISKGGLQTMTRNLADAHGTDKIRFNQINPGWVLSEREDRHMRSAGFPEGWSTQLSKGDAPFGRILRPDEIAAAAVYFLSDESELVSGTVLELEQYPLIGRNRSKD